MNTETGTQQTPPVHHPEGIPADYAGIALGFFLAGYALSHISASAIARSIAGSNPKT
jgi:hypothetical protein